MESAQRIAFIPGVPVDKGGVETSIMNVYRGMNRQEIQIDFIVRKPQRGFYHDEIEELGGDILNMFEETQHKGNKRWNLFMDLYYIYSFYKVIKKRRYIAVHIANPISDGYLIIAAKLSGIPVRIVHSNNTGIDDYVKTSFTTKLNRKLRSLVCNRFATHKWGCSQAANQYFFGSKSLSDMRMEVVPNPITLSDFTNIQIDKIQAKEQLKVPTGKKVFSNVGRFAKQKNQLFLLELFSEMIKIRSDLHLLLAGSGPLESDIKDKIRMLNLEGDVSLLGGNSSIPLVLRASDYFLLPSIYEGFGIVLTEAQAAGVPCFVSDSCQPEANEGLVEYIPLEKGLMYWSEYILSRIDNVDIPHNISNNLLKYDKSVVAPRMQKVYQYGVMYKDA
ncbi:glycosyltransferase [Paenibacillus sp. NPDC057934]|uniref:glycosyltransferase n=1 Tax=Paenibacillus sp. NPDC057934 TaxID=3346282 RepID=UPI0036DBDDE4